MEPLYHKLLLLNKIKEKRREMHEAYKFYDLTDPEVIRCSQELDKLLNKYEKLDRLL